MPVPDFSPGEVLTAAAMDSIGLWLVKTQTIGTAVSSVSVTGAFSSSYDDYLITVSDGAAAATGVLTLQMGSTTTGYKWLLQYTNYGSTTPLATSSAAGSNFNYAGIGLTNGLAMSATILSPWLSKWTHLRSGWSASAEGGTVAGTLENTTSYTGFTLGITGTTMTGGTIRVYGYRK